MATNGIKKIKYGKQTYCLPCYESIVGKLNAKVAVSSKGLSGTKQLEHGTCDKCHKTF